MLKTHEYVWRFQICYFYLYLFFSNNCFKICIYVFLYGLCVESAHIIKNTLPVIIEIPVKYQNLEMPYLTFFIKYGTYVLI
jgi:hypothetical protein